MARFYEAEAAQSDDDVASSDEEDAADEYEALPPEELAAMAAELAERGEGRAELADAHAAWLAAQDDAALTRLRRCVKYGFSKGRARVGQVRGPCHCACSKNTACVLEKPLAAPSAATRPAHMWRRVRAGRSGRRGRGGGAREAEARGGAGGRRRGGGAIRGRGRWRRDAVPPQAAAGGG